MLLSINQRNNELFLFDNSESVYLSLISSAMLNDWPRWFAIPIMHVYSCIKAYSARVNISPPRRPRRTINSVGAYLPPMVINSRTDRNLLKWQQGVPRPLPSRPPFCHKSKSYDRPRYTFIIANGSRNSSYRRITSRRHAGSYSVSNIAVAETAVHPLDKQILIQRLPCARPNFKASLLAAGSNTT